MAQDPINRLAMLRAIKASADLEVQLATKSGSAPTLLIVRVLRDRAAVSLEALAFVDLHTPEGIKQAITLQHEVKRYDEFFTAMVELIANGKQYDQQISDEERDEFLDHLTATPEGQDEAVALGLIDRNPQEDG